MTDETFVLTMTRKQAKVLMDLVCGAAEDDECHFENPTDSGRYNEVAPLACAMERAIAGGLSSVTTIPTGVSRA